MESLEDLRGLVLWDVSESVVEKMIKELLSELLLHVVWYERVRFEEEALPQCILVGMALDCVVVGCKEGAAVELVESGDETHTLEEREQEGIVVVVVEDVDQGVWLEGWLRLPRRLKSGDRGEGEKGERDAVAEPHWLNGGLGVRMVVYKQACYGQRHHGHARPRQDLHRLAFGPTPAPRSASCHPCRTCMPLPRRTLFIN